jgi:hypothetical protein
VGQPVSKTQSWGLGQVGGVPRPSLREASDEAGRWAGLLTRLAGGPEGRI